MLRPTFQREKKLFASGLSVVVGCDEVGRGCLAGPVVAAAVRVPPNLVKGWKDLVRDSKALSAHAREEAAAFIREHAEGFAVGEVDVAAIDVMNIHHASLEAMKRAVRGLRVDGDVAILVDGRFVIPGVDATQTAIVHGDAVCVSIAAASIIAKVHRDALMTRMDALFPEYGFARHKGYATREHRDAIAAHGLTEHHRKTFCTAFL